MNIKYDTLNQAEVTEKLFEVVESSCKKIAPAWPLENMVAVNPYLGFTGKSFDATSVELNYTDSIQMTMSTGYYLEKIVANEIELDDLSEALAKKVDSRGVDEFIQQLSVSEAIDDSDNRMRSLVDLASENSARDWVRLMQNRISSWAASYFDKGQSSWNTAIRSKSIYQSWKMEASVERTPEISGLKGFRSMISRLPDNYQHALVYCLDDLGVTDKELTDLYFQRLFRLLNGWSSFISYEDWKLGLQKREPQNLQEFLSILVAFDWAVAQSLDYASLSEQWAKSGALTQQSIAAGEMSPSHKDRLILQEALDISTQRKWVETFSHEKNKVAKTGTTQAIFCIDVRSEVLRRNLEAVDSSIQTLGFAGFFGFPVNYLPLGKCKTEEQAPVLLSPQHTVTERVNAPDLTLLAHRGRVLQRQFSSVWKSFKSGAITCFSFVSPLGISFLPKLFADTFGWSRPGPDPKHAGIGRFKEELEVTFDETEEVGCSGIPLNVQVEMAKGALTAMSLTENFADQVLLIGHGSSSVNNPHATGLDCGACGGHSGEVNAKLAASVLNKKEVRVALAQSGIHIPKTTRFIAGLHDTITDQVRFFLQSESATFLEQFESIERSFELAGELSRKERAPRLKGAGEALLKRANDWSQVRPEWGLAGCTAFIIGERNLTKGVNLKGQAFLHSYSWKRDQEFAVLEQIMTAPMVVTSWINLQYYGSSVDNQKFGSGNKTLHNVTAGLGVIEGASGDLRQGLAWQSVHDGETLQHLPARLSVIIQAPVPAINSILEKHETVRNLFDNEWLFLYTLNDQGKVHLKYVSGGEWEMVKS